MSKNEEEEDDDDDEVAGDAKKVGHLIPPYLSTHGLYLAG